MRLYSGTSLISDSAVCLAADGSGGGTSVAGESGGGSPAAAPATITVAPAESVQLPEAEGNDGFGADFDIPDSIESIESAPVTAPDGVRSAEGAPLVPATVTPSPPAPTATPAPTTATPASTPAPTATPPAPASTTTTPAPVPPTAATPAQPAPTEAATSSSPGKTLTQVIDEGRATLEAELVKTRFALSPADVEAFESGDAGAIARQSAKVYVETIRSVAEMIDDVVPRIVAQQLLATTAQRSADEEFYGQFRDLEPHRPQVRTLATSLRALHPQMPKAEFIPLLARTAMAALGVTPTAVAPAPVVVPNGNGGVAHVAASPHAPVVSSVPAGLTAARAPTPGSWEEQDSAFDLDI